MNDIVEEQEQETNEGFFFDVKTDDLAKMNSAQISDLTCCQTKKLAMEIFNFCRQNQDFAYNDPEIIRRAEYSNITEDDMMPFNTLAIKLMRKFEGQK